MMEVFFKVLVLCALQKNGAGGQNRTDEASLEGWSFTTKLHPRKSGLFRVTFARWASSFFYYFYQLFR